MDSQQEKYKFRINQVSRLSLFDLKAQKKTIPYKIFYRLPLTYQQNLQLDLKKRSLQAIAQVHSGYYFIQEDSINNYRYSTNRNKSHSKLNNHHQNSFRTIRKTCSKSKTLLPNQLQQNQNKIQKRNRKDQIQTVKIIDKCQNLLKKVVTTNKIGQVKKMSNKDYKKLLIKTNKFFNGAAPKAS